MGLERCDPAELFAFASAVRSPIRRPAWHADALCREPAYALLPWVGAQRQMTTSAVAAMRDVCGRCLVRRECADDVADHPEAPGVWGGTTAKERRQRRVKE